MAPVHPCPASPAMIAMLAPKAIFASMACAQVKAQWSAHPLACASCRAYAMLKQACATMPIKRTAAPAMMEARARPAMYAWLAPVRVKIPCNALLRTHVISMECAIPSTACVPIPTSPMARSAATTMLAPAVIPARRAPVWPEHPRHAMPPTNATRRACAIPRLEIVSIPSRPTARPVWEAFAKVACAHPMAVEVQGV